MLILGIAEYKDAGSNHQWLRLSTWAAQAALSRPGQKPLGETEQNNVRHFTSESDKLKWPKGRKAT